MRLIATKEFRYDTRMLAPGDVFHANERDARLLVGIKKAKESREPGEIAPPPASVAEKIAQIVGEPATPVADAVVVAPEADELDALRTQAVDAGIDVDKRWGAKRLAAEIAATKAAEPDQGEPNEE